VVTQSLELCLCCSFLRDKIKQIPSKALQTVDISAPLVDMGVVEDLLQQVHRLKAQKTRVTVRTQKLKGFRITAVADISTLVKKELQTLFESEFYQAGRQLQVKFRHRRSFKSLDVFT
jgi:hypothetical protein